MQASLSLAEPTGEDALPLLDDRYERLEALGGGGSGEVFKAWDRAAERFVALKRYDGRRCPTAFVYRLKFWRWARLSHPTLVKVLDFGRDPVGTPLLVMEFLEGRTLSQLAYDQQLEAPPLTPLLVAIAEGLSYLHDRGLAHGDLKPGNCLLTPNGPKLLDWGGDAAGTLAYMSPQRLHGAGASAQDDLYALGVLALDLMDRHPPGTVTSARERLRRLKDGPSEAAILQLVEELIEGLVSSAGEVLHRLSSGDGAPAIPTLPAEVPLVAREDALNRLNLPSSEACIVLGGSGVGKSRLAREALSSQETSLLVRGYCKPHGLMPLGPWRDALLARRDELPSPDGTVGGWLDSGAISDKPRLFEALADWLGARLDTRLLLEDLQWADQATLELFAFLSTRLEAPEGGVRLLGTARPGSDVERLPERGRIRLLELAPLDQDAATRLLAVHFGLERVPARFGQWAFELTGGNPLHVAELAGHLVAEGHVRVEGTSWSFPSEPPRDSIGLQRLIRAQSLEVSEDARELLLWGTVLGKRFSAQSLQALTQWPEARLFEALDELMVRRLWLLTEEGLDFRHDQLREALQDAFLAEKVKEAHRIAARYLEGQAAPDAVLAHHFEQAGAWEEASCHYLAAGDLYASQSSLGDAYLAWRKALAIREQHEGPITPDTPPQAVSPQRFDLWERLGVVCFTLDVRLAIEVLAQARWRLTADGTLRRNRSLLGGWVAVHSRLLNWVPPARHDLSDSPSLADQASGLFRYHQFAGMQAVCHFLCAEVDEGHRCLAEARKLLPWPGHWFEGMLLVALGTFHGLHWRPYASGRVSRRALRLMRLAPRGFEERLGLLKCCAYHYVCQGPANAASPRGLEVLEEYLAHARKYQAKDHEAFVLTYRVTATGMNGGAQELARWEGELEKCLQTCGGGDVILGQSLCYRINAWFFQGDWERVASQKDALPANYVGTFWEPWFLVPVALALFALGRAYEGAEIVERLERASSKGQWRGVPLARAWCSLALGHDDQTAQLLETVLQQEGPGIHHHAARYLWALRLLGELRARQGKTREATEAFERALGYSQRLGNSLQSAITLFWRGRTLSSGEARRADFEAAERLFRALGNPHYPAMIARERSERWWVLSQGAAPPLPDARGIEPTLVTVVERAMELARADRGKLLLLTPDGELRTRVTRAREGSAPVEAYSQTVVRQVMSSGQSLWLADVTQDQRFRHGVSLLALDLRTVIGVPLRWNERLRGVLYLDRREASEAFTREDFMLVEALAGYGALALAHAEIAEDELRHRRQAEVLLDLSMALNRLESPCWQDELRRLIADKLECRDVTLGKGSEPVQFSWEQHPGPESSRLLNGVQELARLARERFEYRDRAETERLRAALEEALRKEREALIQQLLHDLRNPIQAIALMNAHLSDWARHQPDAADSVQAIEQQVTFMAAFLKQKLDQLLGRDDAEQADLRAVFEELERRFRPPCAARGQQLAVELPATAQLPLTASELGQLLGNLLDNACKFTPPGGRIVLAGEIANGWAMLTVRDTGAGFGAGTADGSQGYGLGLSYVRQLVQRAGGWIELGDAQPGARVQVGLPTTAWGRSRP